MYFHATVTCHDCREHIDFYVIEWPPTLFVCANCHRCYKSVSELKNGTILWKQLGYL